MLDLNGSAGNAAVVQMLRQDGHPWAQTGHQHGPACAPHAQGSPVQRSVGATVARAAEEDAHLHNAVPDTSPEGQSALLAAAMNSSSESLPSPVVAKAESFYQNKRISSTRLHRDAVAQRATAAMGAEAMTVDNHIFLSAGASVHDKTLIGHELSHVNNNLLGIPETGHSNGAGITVTDPKQGSERAAGNDGTAFDAGETTAPSVIARSRTADGPGETVQRMAASGGPHQHGPGCGHGQGREDVHIQRAAAAYYAPEEDVDEHPGFSTRCTATLNGQPIGTTTSKTGPHSPGDHAEDQLLDILDEAIANHENGARTTALALGRVGSDDTLHHTLVLDLSTSPCSTTMQTCRKTHGEGCTERLIEFARHGYQPKKGGTTHKFAITVDAHHLYQPHATEDVKSKSQAAVDAMKSAGITVIIRN
ncbi:DUF4157 domain-containing protein [Streptomyces endophytica]|uniref:DUF4157 domain-containing protein n=1 Tax=Streptomyces endophytica TaxID=2991496 RepID=A0ABY6PI38_9ACTN|nr:DUF4157 domain-containing protein [Streptomyces endophytica]UZJ33548.1 DUF4157 domain-containing protein [Streptomyces endophytica]